jgi:hypothetical protein
MMLQCEEKDNLGTTMHEKGMEPFRKSRDKKNKENLIALDKSPQYLRKKARGPWRKSL